MKHLARQWLTLLIMGATCQVDVKARDTGNSHPKMTRLPENP
jgi:hypothetical protein